MPEDQPRSENFVTTGPEKFLEQDPSVRKFFLWIRLFETFNNVIRYGAWLGIAYYAYRSIDALAGETTSLEFFHLVTFEFLSKSLPWWVLTMALGLWAILERSIRKRKTEKLTNRIEELETKIDPQRTSSGLSATGDTHPNDERR